MHEEPGTLNGTAALHLVMLGELRSDVKQIRYDMRDVKQRLGSLEQGKRVSIGDLVPYFSGLVVLALAVTGKWEALGQFLQGFAR